ncbi:MAG: ABC transporter ATP-binding protein [Parachlamydiaceae bacterium]
MDIIEIENLSKKYWIHHERRGDSLKEVLSNKMKSWFRKLSLHNQFEKKESKRKEEFLALNDVSLNIQEGDRVALLGRNGAGKSTLLKILSRITEPTKGRVTIHGRVTSLLEVGTGFHPDLTGRENILLNGAIMGMSYKEIKKKFDEIVAFADIEKFLDTPLKRYSSGMFMRLGFAIAAHLDSDIMIVDEVLAVGDAQFQEKCLKKMNEIGAEQRTILFVSHNVGSVLALCNKGIFLENGKVKAYEPIEQCVSRYIRGCPIAGISWNGGVGDDSIRITRAALRAPSSDLGFYYHGEKTLLDLQFNILAPRTDLVLGFSVLNSRHQVIARSRLCDHPDYQSIGTQTGTYSLSFEIDFDFFHPGEYQIKLECSLLNKKNILNGEILLKFAVYSQNKVLKHELGMDKEGISLGNRWRLTI